MNYCFLTLIKELKAEECDATKPNQGIEAGNIINWRLKELSKLEKKA